MNWYHHPRAVDQLASAYVLGTLQGSARRRFEAVMHAHPAVAHAVDAWTQRLGPMLSTLAPMEPSPSLWQTIALRAGIAKAPTAPTARWWQRWLAPLPAGALAAGLVLGTVVPMVWNMQHQDPQATQLPQSYAGVLGTPQGKPGLVVSSLRLGLVVDIKQVTPAEVPAGHTLYLWRIDKDGAMEPIGAFANGKFVRLALAEPAEKVFFAAVELAVSVEPLGTSPTVPTQPFVYRGLCGKLWKPPAS